MSENVAKKKKIISVMAEKNFPDLDKLSNILPLGLRPRGSKNSSFISVWKVIFPSHYGNSYSHVSFDPICYVGYHRKLQLTGKHRIVAFQ